MINYSVQPQDQMFVKGYGFMCFAKNSENIGKNIGKNMSGKYTLILIMLNNLQQMHIKLL